MKVSRYIAELQKLDQDAEVVQIDRVRGKNAYYELADVPRVIPGPAPMLDDNYDKIEGPVNCVFVGGISP